MKNVCLEDSLAKAVMSLGKKSCVCPDAIVKSMIDGIKTSLLNSDNKKNIIQWYLLSFIAQLKSKVCEPGGRLMLCNAWIYVLSKKYDAIMKARTMEEVLIILDRTQERDEYKECHLFPVE